VLDAAVRNPRRAARRAPGARSIRSSVLLDAAGSTCCRRAGREHGLAARRWEERDAVRRAWGAVKRRATSVAGSCGLRQRRHAPGFVAGARGEGSGPCASTRSCGGGAPSGTAPSRARREQRARPSRSPRHRRRGATSMGQESATAGGAGGFSSERAGGRGGTRFLRSRYPGCATRALAGTTGPGGRVPPRHSAAGPVLSTARSLLAFRLAQLAALVHAGVAPCFGSTRCSCSTPEV